MLTILWFIIIGAIIGALARLFIPGKNPMGILMTILVGIIGAIIGGVISNALGTGRFVAFIFALIIAVAAVAAITAFQRRRGLGPRGRPSA
jgi:uncharacterized membrane protein YeaQ/YmgE (transglycosylase-associated protein family)